MNWLCPDRAFAFLLAAAVVGWPAAVLAAPLQLPDDPTALAANLRLIDAYANHPQVWQVYQRGWLSADDRMQLLRGPLPVDRAWAALDAIGPRRMRQHAVERYLLVGVAGYVQMGPSGALRPDDLRTEEADGRAALLLGWAKALAGDAADWSGRSAVLKNAGAVQLLEIAAAKLPGEQAAHLALAIARAQTGGANECALAQAVLTAARQGGQAAVRLAAAERADAVARTWLGAREKNCTSAAWRALSKPIQLPAPAAEDSEEIRSRPPQVPKPEGSDTGEEAFVTAAPIFRGWLDDPTVRTLVLRSPLHEALLAEVLAGDATGDRTIAVLNAGLHGRRTGAWNVADLAWRAVLSVRGLASADEGQQARIKVNDLTPVQAQVLGYAYALAGSGRHMAPGNGRALEATPLELFEAARGALPVAAKLGPALALGHLVDLDRQRDKCKAARRAEALRVTVAKTDLPAAAKQALREALLAVELTCPPQGENKATTAP